MRKVYKFPLDITSRTPVMASILAPVVLVDIDPATGNPAIWLEADWQAEPQIERSFFVIGTGWEIAPDLKHHGSTIDRADFVWHVYERRRRGQGISPGILGHRRSDRSPNGGMHMTLDRHQPSQAKPPRMTFRQQRERTRQIDAIRLQRPLTSEERAEADALAAKLYQRIYRLS